MRRLPWLLAAIYLALATAPALGQQSAANFCLNPNFNASVPGSTRFIACGTEVSGVSTPLVISGSLTPAGTQNVNLTQVGSAAIALGQAAMAASLPVVFASNQSALTVAQATAASLNATVVGTGTFLVQAAQSGTWTVSLPAAGTSVVGTLAAGTSAATSLLTGGVYNSTTPTLTNGQQVGRQVDTQGAMRVNAQGVKKTYRVSTTSVVVTATGTTLQLQGSASKTVTITQIKFQCILTTLATGRVRVFRNSAAETGGTSTAPTIGQLDTAQPNATAATAAALQYSTSGTPGAAVAVIDSERVSCGPTTGVPGAPARFDYGTRNTQGLVLRGTGEYVTIEQNFAAYVGALFDVNIEWTEE